MRAKFIILIFSFLIFLPWQVVAVTENKNNNPNDTYFKAKVIKVIEEKTIQREDGSKATQQNLLLKGLEKEWKNKEINYVGISDLDIISSVTYKTGDVVLVGQTIGINGSPTFYIGDFVRSQALYWLAAIFAIIILIIGKKKGLKALFSLVVSFIIIIKFILPNIISGSNPLLIGIFGTLAILTFNVYTTEGWKKKSHLAVLTIFISLLLTFLLAWLFTHLARLTGMAQEEAMFLTGINNGNINFQGLLLAGLLIGSAGALDDVVIGQIESVDQIWQANPNLSKSQVLLSALKVGNAHLGAIVNTLFLTYAGASLPLLLLFHFNPTGLASFTQIINNETIATEVVRTLVGSIGIALAMPIATILASKWLINNKI